VTPGPFILTSATSTFVGGNQEIVAQATYDAALTPPPPAPPVTIGSVALTGTVDMTVFGRTSNSETGPFTTDITGLDLTGMLTLPPANPLNGQVLDVTLDTTQTSSGTTTITRHEQQFRIDSFFDIFVDASVPSLGLSSPPIGISVAAVPEPSTWAMLLIGFAGLAFAARRRAVGPVG
jgi:hypothetical protein